MLIVIEGVDGVGKSTQSSYLKKHFEEQGKVVKSLHFPTHGSGFYGKLVDKYLNGEFGDLNEVPYKFSAFLYAQNRFENASKLKDWLNKGYIVLLDRYVSSAKAHQAAFLDRNEVEHFWSWLDDLEYNWNDIPKPDKVIVLDADVSVVIDSIEKRGDKDLHESNLDHIKKAIENYRFLSNKYSNWFLIKCDENGKLLSREEIFRKILNIL